VTFDMHIMKENVPCSDASALLLIIEILRATDLLLLFLACEVQHVVSWLSPVDAVNV